MKKNQTVCTRRSAGFFKPWTSLQGAPSSRTADLQLFVWQQTARYGTCYQSIFNGNTSHVRRDVYIVNLYIYSIMHQWKNYGDRVTPQICYRTWLTHMSVYDVSSREIDLAKWWRIHAISSTQLRYCNVKINISTGLSKQYQNRLITSIAILRVFKNISSIIKT